MNLGVFFVIVDVVAAEGWGDLEGVGSSAVDVAGVLDGGASSDVAGEEETRDFGVGNLALLDGFAGDFGKDDVGDGRSLIDGSTRNGVFRGD